LWQFLPSSLSTDDRVDQAELAVVAAIEDIHPAALRIDKDEKVVAEELHLEDRFLHVHGLHCKALGPDDGRGLIPTLCAFSGLTGANRSVGPLLQAVLIPPDLSLDLFRGVVDRGIEILGP